METRYMYEYDGVDTQYFPFDLCIGVCVYFWWIPVK
jgi:hypothetical protein